MFSNAELLIDSKALDWMANILGTQSYLYSKSGLYVIDLKLNSLLINGW